jgi:hypothetical protein
MKSPKEVRRTVVSAMKIVQQKGWKIRRGLTVLADSEGTKGKCCPMFAVLLDKTPRTAKSLAVSQQTWVRIWGGDPKDTSLDPMTFSEIIVKASKCLGIPPYATEAFIAGYDRDKKVNWDGDQWADDEGWASKTLTAAQIGVAKKFYALGKSLQGHR